MADDSSVSTGSPTYDDDDSEGDKSWGDMAEEWLPADIFKGIGNLMSGGSGSSSGGLIEGLTSTNRIRHLRSIERSTGIPFSSIEKDLGVPCEYIHERLVHPMIMNGYGYRQEEGREFEISYEESKSFEEEQEQEQGFERSIYEELKLLKQETDERSHCHEETPTPIKKSYIMRSPTRSPKKKKKRFSLLRRKATL